MSDNPVVIEAKDLGVDFWVDGVWYPAAIDMNYEVYPGKTLAIVGESGSGKSTTAHAIINLLPGAGRIAGGSIVFDGKELVGASESALEAVRGSQIGFVPQDPMSNLNPVWSIGFQVEEAIAAGDGELARQRVREHLSGTLTQIDRIRAEHPEYLA